MMIPFGRRRLLQIAVIPSQATSKSLHVPAAADATDAELARLAGRRAALVDRARWEGEIALYGGVRPR